MIPERDKAIFNREFEIGVLKQEHIKNCPYVIFDYTHYRKDGSCKCSNAKEREMMIREWEYTLEHFKDIPLVD